MWHFGTQLSQQYHENLAQMAKNLVPSEIYCKMSNNVVAEIKPIGTVQDFSATHLGHYETFLQGLAVTIWDITRLIQGH